MTLPTSRATRNESHASNLAYALVGLIKAGGLDGSSAEIFEAVTQANKALRAYKIDNPAFYG